MTTFISWGNGSKMDRVKAKDIEAKLKGQALMGFEIDSFVNNGKSAAVFKGRDSESGKLVAIKVFDDELIAKYGDAVQLKRIERELELVGKSHPNMVQIFGGGFDELTQNHYLIMEYLDGPNLKDCLQEVSVEHVPMLVSQLAKCCEYLEGLGLVHRDIKPENIVLVDSLSKLVLLDFGVVRPIGRGDLTDGDGVQSFVGTLQYSSPEFLLREEKDTIEGWRSLTFYQIGAVMHDLIMRRPIFEESLQPYARLVNAVQQDTPTVSSKSLPSYLIETARLCLSKIPEVRANILSWESFHAPDSTGDPLKTIKERVSQRAATSALEQIVTSSSSEAETALLEDVISHLKVKVRAVRNSNRAAFPPAIVTRDENLLCVEFGASAPHGLLTRIRIWFSVGVIDSAAGVIELNVSGLCAESKITGPDVWHLIFRGLASGSDLSASVEGCLYCAIDQAQQAGAVSDALILNFDQAVEVN